MRLSTKLAMALVLALSSYSSLWSGPLHPDILKKMENGEIPKPYWLEHSDELLAQGIDAPRRVQLACDIASGAVRQNFNAIAILVDFPDTLGLTQASYFDNLLFGNQTGTLRDYWREVTYGNLTIVTLDLPSALGWQRVSQPYKYYSTQSGAFPSQNAEGLAIEALGLADPFVRFANYDNDGNDTVDALYIIHAGSSWQYTGNGSDFQDMTMTRMRTPQQVDGVTVAAFAILSEYLAAPGDMTVGGFAHETGHLVFGLPDLYDRDYSSQGLGAWSLMGYGGWNGPMVMGESPAHPDAWCRIRMGLVVPTILSSNLLGAAIPAVESTPTIFRLWTNGTVGQQYMLVENRLDTGYDFWQPSQGLLIYHVDDSVRNNDNEWYPGYTNWGHYRVALEQADGLWQLEQNISMGDWGDPYPGSTMNRTYDNSSTPDSRDYNFNTTGVAVLNISNQAPVMTADLYIVRTLGPGIIDIYGDILVNSGDILRILPGTTLNFLGPYRFNIWGTLLAEGTADSSIVFTTQQSGSNRWRGLRFQGDSSSGSRSAYYRIENGYARGSEPDDRGGGVFCYGSSPTFTNCTVSGNWANFAGGVCCDGSSPTFTNCTISGNSVTGADWADGGGVSCSFSSPTFVNCTISENTATANRASGGGVYCWRSSATFAGCSISGNFAYFYGGGVVCEGSTLEGSSSTFTNCTLSGNLAPAGGGVFCEHSSPSFTNCTLNGNTAGWGVGGGMYCANTSPEFTTSPIFTNCVLSGNTGGGVECLTSSPRFNSTIIAFSTGGPGIYFIGSSGSQVGYCDIFDNSGGPFQGEVPAGLGQIITTPNANGDPCDGFMNIFLDPEFAGAAMGDFHLTDFSHCIGAGDPTNPPENDFEDDDRPDPPGSNPDIGADENPNPRPRELSGPLEGTLAPGAWRIIGTISVNSGRTLTLLPGTTFIFRGPYSFQIFGALLAEGTETDSIVFTTDQSDTNRWRGLRFTDTGSSGSRLACCLIEKGYATANWPDNSGGGVYCLSSSPTFTNCTVSGNSASYYSSYGGGVFCNSSSPSFTNCTVSGNSANFRGGGVDCYYYSSPSFINCIISGNSAGGYGGGGVDCYYYSSPSFTNCTVSGNSALTSGGGVACYHNSSSSFTNCTVSGNSALQGGGGVYCYSSSPTIKSTIIAFSTGSGILFYGSAGSQVRYCDIFGNSGGNIAFWGDDPPGPPGIGQLVTTNANGDSADVYMNIFLDPSFVNRPGGDFHLQDTSRCIGAADPADTVSTDFEGDPRPMPLNSYRDIGMDEHPFGAPGVIPIVTDQVVSMSEPDGNMVLSWSSLGAESYNIYGATEPFTAGVLLGTTNGTTWTDTETSNRPSPYFYYMTAEWPSRPAP